MPAPPSVHPSPPRVAERLTDFGDRLPPMLVKELRQGLRARSFMVVFLSLQGLLLLILLCTLAAIDSSELQQAGRGISGVIFTLLTLALLVVQPLRLIGALHREIHSQTIELMVLTRLSARRIVLGKWISHLGQSLLLAAAVIPYLILRFWFGGMDLYAELATVLAMLLGSATWGALVLGFSGLSVVLLRGLLPILVCGLVAVLSPTLWFSEAFDQITDRLALRRGADFCHAAVVVLAAAHLAWTGLGIGASCIAPLAENHATLKRVIGLVTVTLVLVVAMLTPLSAPLLSISLAIIVLPTIALALTEDFVPLPSLQAPFERRGPLGKLAAALFFPGWPAAVAYSLAILAPAAAGLAALPAPPLQIDQWLTASWLVGSLLLPAALLSLLGRRVRSRVTAWVMLWVGGGLLASILGLVMSVTESATHGSFWPLVSLPQAVPVLASFPATFPPETLLSASLGMNALYLLTLIAAAILAHRRAQRQPPTGG